ncbi:MAG: flavodoxin family protein [Kiritimatiellaeota bacterium]|nr:flavodoxin family protein [Kiritimatiellota bacterium]
MKKILILTSSPNVVGNSNTMATVFEEAARQQGADVTRLDLNRVTGSGCCACMRCRTASDRCVVQDGIGDALKAFEAADVLVMAAPVWFAEFPVSLRRFVERWQGLVDTAFLPRLPNGKRAVLLISQGGGEDEFTDIPTRYAGMLNWLGVKPCDIVRHCTADKQAITNGTLLDTVRQLATNIISG